ncbi:MFS transporter [Allopusillimonas soli]|uniref:MFS transporter n=1 Tax=Allopusillimonas soli TaxID=659016 RepID=A0A853FD89_9BURK|nr:MFS transporter [Allopusillimonas soli]NYT36820.1 MFS transporter [Allopusillimonas soli]TEA75283.1 MFS transporter [Allopusillimonas soli]
MTSRTAFSPTPESPYAWARLFVSLLLMTIGGSGMYSLTVVLPQIQADFDISRSQASLPYTLTMVGFGLGGIVMGKLSDRMGVMAPILIGAAGLGGGYILAGAAGGLWGFILWHSLFIGLLGTAATFTPLVADTSLWFTRRRGIALGICMSGNYVAGAIWPPIIQHYIDTVGWRATYQGIGVFCLVSILALVWIYRRRPPSVNAEIKPGDDTHSTQPQAPLHPSQLPRHLEEAKRSNPERPLGFTPAALTMLLSIAGVACCVAMSMPQVHIVAYCGDLGFGAARGAEMLSLMLGLGIASRLASGWISDHIGGLRTLMLGSLLQCVALCMFLFTKGLVSLYVVSALFGLFQGGIVPAYALVVREYFAPKDAGTRTGIVLMATLFGMALGGWLSGAIYDLSGGYRAAFVNGIAWNLLNGSIVAYLIFRARRGLLPVAGPAAA